MKRTVSTILTAVLAASLFACGSDDDSGADAAHNDADVVFATGMIPHHAQAIEMSDLLLAKEDVDTQVVELAEQITSAQTPEIDTMSGWLEQWGETVPPTSGMENMEEMPSTDGMMSPQDMARLESAAGDEASRLYLEQMIEHHTGAIDMAQQEAETGSYQPALTLAEDIIESQQAEIETMQGLLSQM